MMKRAKRALGIGVLALMTMSCGGSSSSSGESSNNSGTCGKVEPCNGPIVGTWNAAAACIPSFAMTIQSGCSAATISGTNATQSGKYVFNADLTYSIAVTGQFTFDYTFPASCNPTGISCAALASAAQSSGGPGSTVTCTGSGSCNCHGTLVENDTETGTYSVAGTVITMVNDADGSSTDQSYCVQGNTLHILDVDATTNLGPMGQATIVDDATYTKP